MKFDIVIGRAKTGKSTYLRDLAIEKMDAGEKVWYLVPEHMTYSTELDLIKQSNRSGFLKLNVTSFQKLQTIVLSEVGANRKDSINDYGKIMLLKQICDANKENFSFYANSVKKEGFLREVNNLLTDIKKSRQDIKIFERASEEVNNKRLSDKLRDLSLIYNLIDSNYKDKFTDSQDLTNLFIENIKNSETIKDTHIIFDGFESLIGQRLSIIKEMIKYAKTVTFSLCLDISIIEQGRFASDFEAFDITYNTYQDLIKMSENIQVSPEIINMENRYIDIDEFKFIEEKLFETNISIYEGKAENINILPAENIYEEIKNICCQISSLVRKNGYRYKDIAVITGSTDAYSLAVKNTFNQFNIPIFIDEKKSILNNPVIKYILLLLEMLIYNFKQQTVIDFLKTGYYDIEYNELDRLENFALEYGIEGYRWFKPFKTQSKDNDFCETLRLKFEADFNNIRKKFVKLDKAKDITLFIYEILDRHKIAEKINKKIDQFRAVGLVDLAYINAQVWNSAMDICEQIILTADDSLISPLEYKKIIEAGFKEIKLSIIPPAIDKVVFGDLDRASITKYKAVFIIGANEGVLLPIGNDKGLLMDREILSLREFGINLINSSTFNTSKYKHLIYKAMSSASEKLFISYAHVSMEEKSMEKSVYLDKIHDLFPHIEELSFDEEYDKISNSDGTYEYFVEKMTAYINGKELSDVWKAVYKWYLEKDPEKVELLKAGLDYKNSENVLDEELAKKLYGNRLDISVSKLEKFSKCNFQYFIEYGLKAMKRKELKVEFYNIGNVFHNAVQLFINMIIDGKLSIEDASDSDIVAAMIECIDYILGIDNEDKRVLDYNNRNMFVKTKIKRLLSRVSLIIARQLKNSDFRPYKTEVDIRKDIESDLIDKIAFNGRVDRIDYYEEDNKIYFNIIDYKSSGKKLDISDAINGFQLQLLAYMSVLLNQKENKQVDKEVGGVFYFNIDDPFIESEKDDIDEVREKIFSEFKLNGYLLEDTEIACKIDNSLAEKNSSDVIPVRLKKDGSFYSTSNVLAENQYRKLLNIVEDKVKELSENIIKGDISINPCKQDDKIPCSYCEYKAICQFDPLIEGNSYRIIKKHSKEEISDILEK